ncbi:MAG TPA: beta-ketoacyl-[acyl-carrier-protein] synthase family protein [Burkholderiales bacterium]|nr:beta-ketoacyl-[acyl-carrier-protein] synthase family protein [Burkholderiales bacterium]
MSPLQLTCYSATSCLGRGLAPMQAALRARASGLAHQPFESAPLDTFIGAVDGLDAVRLPTALAAWDCRNNRLAELGLAQDGFADAARVAAARLGTARIGVFLGTSTSGIHQTELAYRRRDAASGALPADFDYARTHNTYSVSGYVRARLGLAGPAWTVSTACSSSAKVFGTAARLIDAGMIDAAVVGGVDSLCLTTLYGFNSLELLAHEACRPWDRARTGLSIGEAAAFALLERPTASPASGAVLLLGVGESSDAHHMSSPHPEGLGARLAMQAALQAAALQPGDIDYLNLHGTATPSNDAAEDRAVVGLFGRSAPCSSTKGATGHTLGAAGALEAVVAALSLRAGFIPGGAQTSELDPALGANYVLQSRDAPLGRVLSNSFGFGGTNCSLVLGRA